ncbi:thioesterase superfamily protein [Syntrophotalea carbinolica DSM 2380]|uniref:Thioesterase superfamily protein n=1 Tax=Syntrophotalea carbinolica (strain DSM 2380 / NBRC 103641 / GraBd1) TaxID=338963 RepID=Q3A3D7_SYNC1|nr:PaaI family thioesterase [Syntrophotalea carbinolica]ABA89120.1 thioesterase superfamily protein [Syntrophotalea carbinolica DSM 2380]
MQSRTHKAISPTLVGEMVELKDGEASAQLKTFADMSADDHGLVHGGFTFGLADYAAMLAVNDPFVVLGAADVRFLAPVRCGDTMKAHAILESREGKKHSVFCTVEVEGKRVFEATFTCFVLEKHILD